MTKKPPVLLLPQNRIAAYMLPSEFDSHPVKERERERERETTIVRNVFLCRTACQGSSHKNFQVR